MVGGTIPIAPGVGSGSCFIEVDVTVPTGPTTTYTNTLLRASFGSTPATTVDGSGLGPGFSIQVNALSALTACLQPNRCVKFDLAGTVTR